MNNSPSGLGLLLLSLSACQPDGPADISGCGLPSNQIGLFARVPAGSYTRSADPVYAEEGPPSLVKTKSFEIQIHEVTNLQFSAFVNDAGYVTDAERSSQSGNADGGSALFVMPENMRNERPWRLINGATWRDPEGDGGDLQDKQLWPVVHVSLRDAKAYASWAGGRLPTEIEWEHAAALGLPNPNDQRSGAFDASGKPIANTWQGLFPIHDKAEDGFSGPAPVGCYAANRLGVYDLIGNVWEWTTTAYGADDNYTIKGGSFLCSDNFCGRYRPAARQPQAADFSTSHIGFRIVRDG